MPRGTSTRPRGGRPLPGAQAELLLGTNAEFAVGSLSGPLAGLSAAPADCSFALGSSVGNWWTNHNVGRWLEVAGIVVAAICVVIEVSVAWEAIVAVEEVTEVTEMVDPTERVRPNEAFIEVRDEEQNLQNLFFHA